MLLVELLSDESIWMASKICIFLGVFLFTLFYNVSLNALNITVYMPDSALYWFLPVHMWILFCSSPVSICFHSVLSPTLGGVHPAEKTMSLSNLWTCFTTSLASRYTMICAYIQPLNIYSHLPSAVHNLTLWPNKGQAERPCSKTSLPPYTAQYTPYRDTIQYGSRKNRCS